MIAFVIPGEAVAFARSGGNGKIRFTPKRQRDFAALVKFAAAEAMERAGMEPFTGAVSMQVRAVYLTPSSWSKKKAALAKWRTARPDIDNVVKLICDAANTIVFTDDALVAELTAQKVYGIRAEVVVSVQSLDVGG